MAGHAWSDRGTAAGGHGGAAERRGAERGHARHAREPRHPPVERHAAVQDRRSRRLRDSPRGHRMGRGVRYRRRGARERRPAVAGGRPRGRRAPGGGDVLSRRGRPPAATDRAPRLCGGLSSRPRALVFDADADLRGRSGRARLDRQRAAQPLAGFGERGPRSGDGAAQGEYRHPLAAGRATRRHGGPRADRAAGRRRRGTGSADGSPGGGRHHARPGGDEELGVRAADAGEARRGHPDARRNRRAADAERRRDAQAGSQREDGVGQERQTGCEHARTELGQAG